MDIKITSITKEIMEIALDQAKDGRIHILEAMNKTITETRSKFSGTCPSNRNCNGTKR